VQVRAQVEQFVAAWGLHIEAIALQDIQLPPDMQQAIARKAIAERDKQYVIIPPNSFALCETVEYLEIPRDVLAICVGKSTYARCGLIVNVTPLEPEWRGKVTLEISNTTPLPARVYANEGVAQLVFLKADRLCEVSYADKGGKYQDQSGLTLPKVD
jgi:dCTP deaminase